MIYIDKSMKQVCEELEEILALEDEQSMLDEPEEDNNPLAGYYCPAYGEALEEGHMCAELDVLAQDAWKDYRSSMCLCGDAECGGVEWILRSNDPFEVLEVEL